MIDSRQACGSSRSRLSVTRPPSASEVLPGGHDPPHVAPGGLRVARERLDGDDPLSLLAGDLRPVVRVGGVGEILVLLELLPDRAEQVVARDALRTRLDVSLEGELLRPPYDGFDHGAGGKVLEVEHLFVPVAVGHLEEAVPLAEV